MGWRVLVDPIWQVDGASIYGYVKGNPARYVDPTGELVPQLLGIALGVGFEYLTNPRAKSKDLAFADVLGRIAFNLIQFESIQDKQAVGNVAYCV